MAARSDTILLSSVREPAKDPNSMLWPARSLSRADRPPWLARDDTILLSPVRVFNKSLKSETLFNGAVKMENEIGHPAEIKRRGKLRA